MNCIRKTVTVILLVVFTYGLFAAYPPVAYAAATPVRLYADSYNAGALTFHWDALANTRSVVVTYHTPNATDDPQVITDNADTTGNTFSISGLKSDYIYDIHVRIYDQPNGAGTQIGIGMLYYLPKITFYATALPQTYTGITGGGREIGEKPQLQLRWVMPKVFNGTDKFVYANTQLLTMQNTLDAVYDDGRVLDKLNFRINISTDQNKLNGGSTQAAVVVEQGGGVHTAKVPGFAPTAAVQYEQDSLGAFTGYMRFELWGRSDPDSAVPAPGAGDPEALPHNDIYPGAVYYMNIKPTFKDGSNNDVNAVTVGIPADQNGSMLSGVRQYVSTPIRFQLTRDSFDNIYVKIYKINQGSLDLPRLFYEVQSTDDSSIPGDWTVKKTLDDSYFSDKFAVTVISGVNPNNLIYYKLVVKSDSPNDRLESSPLPYELSVDTSRPPVPMGIALLDRKLSAANKPLPPPSAGTVDVKSTDVTLSWEKPKTDNWDIMREDLYFHFLLSTSQSDLSQDVPLYVNGTFWNNYKPKYRLVKYISAKATNPNLRVVGNRIEYTLKAFELFQWEDDNGNKTAIANPDNYPDFLLPNTVYYLQMYTTNALNRGSTDSDDMSDKSVVFSFTTLNGVQLDVPLPMNFELFENNKDISVVPPVNYVEVTFDKVTQIDWSSYFVPQNPGGTYEYHTYYDLYMNSRPDTPFTRIGTTEGVETDVDFTGQDDQLSTSIRARISSLTGAANPAAYALFGGKLLPNTTYYFYVKTRLVVMRTDPNPDVLAYTDSSIATAILPVTTVPITVNEPDPADRKPLAPTDFAIAEDEDGNPRVDGNSVTFSWERKENDVAYELICTPFRIAPDELETVYDSAPEYMSFINTFDLSVDRVDDNRVWLNPVANPLPGLPGRFSYDSTTKMCTFTIDTWLFPNKLYYFSLRAVRRPVNATAPSSVWVCIPVTTSLIEGPARLEVVSDAQLGFFWTDPDINLLPEDFKIYAKGPGDADYVLITRAQSTVVKDQDGKTYYGRIMGLKLNSTYDIRVYKGLGNSTLIYEKRDMHTRDGFHEIEVRWQGLPTNNLASYELAVKSEDASDYTTLGDADLEWFFDKDGNLTPFYIQESADTVTDPRLVTFYARIRRAEITLPGGIKTRQPLKSNTKYYIKVRATQKDAVDAGLTAFSKYVGPVGTRTEFSQDDYDNTDREEKEKAVFLDRMKELEQDLYWRMSINYGTASKVLLKGDRIVNALRNTRGNSLTVDMSSLGVNLQTDMVYIPVSVVKTLNEMNKSLVIKARESEFTLRPRTLDASENQQIRDLLRKPAVKDLYLQLTIQRSTSSVTGLPAGGERVSGIHDLDVTAVGASRTDSELKKLFYDKLYDQKTGLVSQKMNMLLNAYIGNGPDASKIMDEYIAKLVEMIESELSTYIDSTLESSKVGTAVQSVTTFAVPVSARITFQSKQGRKQPYVLYDGSAAWQKVTANTVLAANTVTLNMVKTGKVVVLLTQASAGDVPSTHWAREDIARFMSQYDISDIFTNISTSFAPENRVTCKEVVLLYERVTGRTSENAGLDIRQKAEKLGLEGIINLNGVMKNIQRQETAAVLVKLFAVKRGMNEASLRPGGNIDLNDGDSIEEDFYYPVLMVVDWKVMSPDSNGNFWPASQMTRAEVISAMVRLLEMTGDMRQP